MQPYVVHMTNKKQPYVIDTWNKIIIDNNTKVYYQALINSW